MYEMCDRCATGNCGECEAGRGTLPERVKARIAARLTNFLLSEKQTPEKIEIYVRYENSTARLTIGASEAMKITREN